MNCRPFLLFLFSIFLWGCYPDDFDKMTWGPEPQLELAVPGVNFQSEAGTVSVDVLTNYSEWEFFVKEEGVTWCSAEREEDALLVHVQENTSNEERSATIVVAVGRADKQKTLELAVTQLGATAYAELESTTIVFDNQGGSNRIEVSSNVGKWTASVTIGNDWCGVSGNANELMVTATPYTGKQQRQAVITLNGETGEILATFIVVQTGSDPVLDVGTVSPFEKESGVQEVQIITNQTEWTVTVPGTSPWCTAHRSGDKLMIVLEANETGSTRTCELLLTASNGLLRNRVRVVQFGDQPELILSQDTLNLNAAGGISTITVLTNRDWEAESDNAGWFTFLKSNNTLTLQVEENPSGTALRSGEVTVSAAGLSKVLKIIQQPAIALQPGGGVDDWEKDSIGGNLEELVQERDLLIEFYYEMGGDNWTEQEGWKSRKPLAEWYGVTTDEAGYVTGLDLSANGLTGHLSDMLAGLKHLQVLRLSLNYIEGTVPEAIRRMDCYVREEVARQYDSSGNLIYLDED